MWYASANIQETWDSVGDRCAVYGRAFYCIHVLFKRNLVSVLNLGTKIGSAAVEGCIRCTRYGKHLCLVMGDVLSIWLVIEV